MTPSHRALRTAIDADPALAPMSDQQVADELNAPGAMLPRPIPLATLRQWCAGASGVRAAIENFVAAQRGLPAASQSPAYGACLTLQDLFWGAADPFDPSDPKNIALMQVLVAAGIATASLMQQLAGIVATPGPSRAALIVGWATAVQAPDITFARSL